MAVVQMAPLTAEDYRQLPAGGPRYQLIQGDLFMAPAPSRYHQDIALNLALIIGVYLQRQPLGKLYVAPFDVYLDETNVFQPDLVYITQANCSILTDEGARGVPDLIIEILSSRTEQLDKKSKRRVYAHVGVKELWLVDPGARLIDVYRLDQDAEHPAASYAETDSFTCPFFPGLTFDGLRIFRR